MGLDDNMNAAIATTNYLISFDNTENDTVANITVLNTLGSTIINSRIKISILEEILAKMSYLLFDNIPLFVSIPMSNTLYRYGLYGSLSHSKLYNIILIRENLTDDTNDTILKETFDNFELNTLISDCTESINCLKGI